MKAEGGARTMGPGSLGGGRIEAVDLARGLVMIVMALDHTREYFYAGAAVDATDPAQSHPVLFATRWVTYLCAPTFVLLAGLSAGLRRQSRGSAGGASRYLATRGLWLILLELTVVAVGFTFHPGMLFLQVIWVIGAGMILLAAMTRLPPTAVLGLGVLMVAGHDLLDGVDPASLGHWSLAYAALFGRFAVIDAGPFHGVLLYSLVGWAGVMFIGYGLAPAFRMAPGRRDRTLAIGGLAMIAAFLCLRAVNHYGDPVPWTAQPTPARALMAFMRVSKYPPSLDFVLATLGPMLLLLPLLARWRGRAMAVVRTYGRTPLFYYVLHIYLIHGLAALAGLAQGRPFSQFTDPLKPPQGFGFSLPVVYVIWIAVVAGLYPLCRWFEGFRARRRDWWLSYL